MNSITIVASIILAGLLTNNVMPSKLLSICPILGVTKKARTIALMSAAVTLVMVITTAVTWPIYSYLLYPKFIYLEIIISVFLVVLIVKLTAIVLKSFKKSFYDSLGGSLLLITINCVILGMTTLNIINKSGFIESLIKALFAGLGFMIALFLFAGIRERMETVKAPEILNGLPTTLVTAAIISLAFLGFI